MKQLVVNQLEGGFVVQTIEDGKQVSQAVATNYGQVTKLGRGFFGLNGKNELDSFSPEEHYDTIQLDEPQTLEGEFTSAERGEEPVARRRGRPRKEQA